MKKSIAAIQTHVPAALEEWDHRLAEGWILSGLINPQDLLTNWSSPVYCLLLINNTVCNSPKRHIYEPVDIIG